MRTIGWALAALGVSAALAGCGLRADDTATIVGKSSLTIGVKADQPGLGLRGSDGRYQGFDVDVATYVAGRLGVRASAVKFVETPSKVREGSIQQGKVDLIFATYSITAERKTKVGFAGPYYVAHQDTLVRSDDAGVNNVRDLAGRKLCAVTGSASWQRVINERRVKAQPVETDSYSDCVKQLTARTVDAVSTDDLILAGFAAQNPQAVRLINAPISDEKYGVGILKDDVEGCEAVNEALTQMYQDGTAQRLLKKWFGKTTLKTTFSVPQFEGCS